MVDIRFITILPTQSIQGVQPYQPTTNENTPSILATLPSGSILSGYIVNRDPSGNPILRTENADIVFSTNFFLKISSEVVIRVENRAGQSNAHILSVNGQPPEVAETQSAFANEPEVIVGNSPASPQRNASAPIPDTIVSRSPINVTVSGTLLTAPPGTNNETAPLPPGTQLTLKIANYTPPATTPTQPATAPAAAQNPAQAPANPLYSIYRPAQPVAPATPAAAFTASEAPAVTPAIPNATSETIAPLAIPKPVIGTAIAATVIGNEPSGEAILHTQVGVVRLNPGNASLPIGGKITFELMQLLAPALQNMQMANTSLRTPLPELVREWESLKQIFTLLTGRTLTPEMQSATPLPGLLTPNTAAPHSPPTPQGLTAGLMVFIAALKGSDFRNWLGKSNSEWLEKNGHDLLLRRAEIDFATLARAYGEPQPHQWQSLFFPFVVAGELHQARMFTKRDKKKDGDRNKKGDDTRFVLEVELSQLGEMQMDGFVRKREREIQFDLIIRSHSELPDAIKHDILTIYNSTGELTGYRGSVAFQAVVEFPVNPLDEMAATHLQSLIV